MSDINRILDSTILVVDDQVGPREYIRAALKNLYNVTLVSSGKECLSQVSINKYDIIILDIKMPDMNGLQVLETIIERDPHQSVIIITGIETKTLSEKAKKLGAKGFLSKPFKIGDVRDMVRDILLASKKG